MDSSTPVCCGLISYIFNFISPTGSNQEIKDNNNNDTAKEKNTIITERQSYILRLKFKTYIKLKLVVVSQWL